MFMDSKKNRKNGTMKSFEGFSMALAKYFEVLYLLVVTDISDHFYLRHICHKFLLSYGFRGVEENTSNFKLLSPVS
jgi:hypothetical protein